MAKLKIPASGNAANASPGLRACSRNPKAARVGRACSGGSRSEPRRRNRPIPARNADPLEPRQAREGNSQEHDRHVDPELGFAPEPARKHIDQDHRGSCEQRRQRKNRIRGRELRVGEPEQHAAPEDGGNAEEHEPRSRHGSQRAPKLPQGKDDGRRRRREEERRPTRVDEAAERRNDQDSRGTYECGPEHRPAASPKNPGAEQDDAEKEKRGGDPTQALPWVVEPRDEPIDVSPFGGRREDRRRPLGKKVSKRNAEKGRRMKRRPERKTARRDPQPRPPRRARRFRAKLAAEDEKRSGGSDLDSRPQAHAEGRGSDGVPRSERLAAKESERQQPERESEQRVDRVGKEESSSERRPDAQRGRPGRRRHRGKTTSGRFRQPIERDKEQKRNDGTHRFQPPPAFSESLQDDRAAPGADRTVVIDDVPVEPLPRRQTRRHLHLAGGVHERSDPPIPGDRGRRDARQQGQGNRGSLEQAPQASRASAILTASGYATCSCSRMRAERLSSVSPGRIGTRF